VPGPDRGPLADRHSPTRRSGTGDGAIRCVPDRVIVSPGVCRSGEGGRRLRRRPDRRGVGRRRSPSVRRTRRRIRDTCREVRAV
jgi:hypothetical protein